MLGPLDILARNIGKDTPTIYFYCGYTRMPSWILNRQDCVFCTTFFRRCAVRSSGNRFPKGDPKMDTTITAAGAITVVVATPLPLRSFIMGAVFSPLSGR